MCRLWLWEFQQKPPELTRDSIPQQLAISFQRQPIQVYKLGRSLKRKTKQNPRSPMLRGIWIYTDLRTTIWLHTMSMSFFGKYEINNQLEVTLLGLWPNSNPRWQHIWYPQISQMCCNSSSRWFVEKHPTTKRYLLKQDHLLDQQKPGVFLIVGLQKELVSQAKRYGWRSRWIGLNRSNM